MKISLVSPLPPPYGGIAHWTTLIRRYADRTACGVKFLQIDTAPRWRSFYNVATGMRVIGGGTQLLRDFRFFLMGLRERPDLVHLTSSGSLAVFRDLLIGVTCRLFRVPLVYHIHFGRVPDIAAANTLEWHMLAATMRSSGVVIAITPQTVKTIEHYLPGVRAVYLPNPVDFAILPSAVDEIGVGKTALFLGWISPAKGVEELIRAWSELAPKDWRLLLVGPANPPFQQNLCRHYNPGNLEFVGEVSHSQAMRFMSQSDLVVLPSYTEGFPNVILEAMALGKPVIATSVGAITDMISGECGLLIDPKNLGELKIALSRLMQDENLRNYLGKRAKTKAQQEYCIESVFQRYISIYQSLVLPVEVVPSST